MARVVSFINLKGGVGKTTTTVALAEFLAEEQSKRVLVVDLDPQTNATVALIPETDWERRDQKGLTLRQLFKDRLERTSIFDIEQAIVKRVSNVNGGIENLDLLPSSLGLVELQDQLALIPGGNFYATSPVDILRSVLSHVLAKYDYVLIDCPPNLGIITLNGIRISSQFVVPVIPDILSTYGLNQILGRISSFATETGCSVQPLGILVSKFRAQTNLHKSRLAELRRKAAAGELPPVFDTVIPEAIQIAESADVNAPVNTLRQKYGYGNNYEVYLGLSKEFVRRC